MTDFADKVEVIELMAEHEKTIADLYFVFSEKFPECKIWEYLYGEEIKHAEWLKSILNNVFDGSMDFTDMHMSERGIRISINNLQTYKMNVEEGKIELEEAFNIAFTLENSLIEDHYLDYFTSDHEGIMKVVNDLKKDTINHRNLIKEKRDAFIIEKRNKNWQT